MLFTDTEKTALLKVATDMMTIDGILHDKELDLYSLQFARLGCTPNEVWNMLEASKVMDENDILIILSSMSVNKKKYASGFLSTLMKIDGDIDESEMRLWKEINEKCGFPLMTFSEATEFWYSNFK